MLKPKQTESLGLDIRKYGSKKKQEHNIWWHQKLRSNKKCACFSYFRPFNTSLVFLVCKTQNALHFWQFLHFLDVTKQNILEKVPTTSVVRGWWAGGNKNWPTYFQPFVRHLYQPNLKLSTYKLLKTHTDVFSVPFLRQIEKNKYKNNNNPALRTCISYGVNEQFIDCRNK